MLFYQKNFTIYAKKKLVQRLLASYVWWLGMNGGW